MPAFSISWRRWEIVSQVVLAVASEGIGVDESNALTDGATTVLRVNERPVQTGCLQGKDHFSTGTSTGVDSGLGRSPNHAVSGSFSPLPWRRPRRFSTAQKILPGTLNPACVPARQAHLY